MQGAGRGESRLLSAARRRDWEVVGGLRRVIAQRDRRVIARTVLSVGLREGREGDEQRGVLEGPFRARGGAGVLRRR